MELGERGYHEVIADSVESESLYVYRFDDGEERPDPASRFQPQGVHGPSEVVDSSFGWEDDSWSGPPLEEYVVYELHVGTFTPEGTFDAIIPHLEAVKELGVTAIELIPRAVAGTENVGEVLPNWCIRHQFRSIVVVSTPDHSRRLHRVLHRAMRDDQTRVRIRVTRHSGFDPDRWWETRGGIRTEIIELQKLLFDLLRHTLS